MHSNCLSIIYLFLCSAVLTEAFPRLHYGFPLQGKPIHLGPNQTENSDNHQESAPVVTCASVSCPEGRFCTMKSGGPECECYPKCQTFAPETPVCGSNGKTYSGMCQFRWETCINNEDARLVSEGECPCSPNDDD